MYKFKITVKNIFWSLVWYFLLAFPIGALYYKPLYDFLQSVIDITPFKITQNHFYDLIYFPFVFFLIALVIERYFTRANLVILPGTIDKDLTDNRKFIHVHVINLDWPKWFLLFRRRTASTAQALISFRKRHSKHIQKSIIGRWATNTEPVTLAQAINQTGKQINISPSNNIRESKEGLLDLVVSIKGPSIDESDSYIFNDENYTEQKTFPRLTRHHLTDDEYEVDVFVYSGQSSAKRTFLLLNVNNYNNIRLEEMPL